jgi:hypothetical protein
VIRVVLIFRQRKQGKARTVISEAVKATLELEFRSQRLSAPLTKPCPTPASTWAPGLVTRLQGGGGGVGVWGGMWRAAVQL